MVLCLWDIQLELLLPHKPEEVHRQHWNLSGPEHPKTAIRASQAELSRSSTLKRQTVTQGAGPVQVSNIV